MTHSYTMGNGTDHTLEYFDKQNRSSIEPYAEASFDFGRANALKCNEWQYTLSESD